MGCGSSAHVVSNGEELSNGHAKLSNGSTDGRKNDDQDDLPTVVLPELPVKKPPIAFEIPLEEMNATRKGATSPPPHIQRLLQPPQPEITLPVIEGKLAEAENRRQLILQQRAASAQRRAQKMLKSLHEMDRLDSEHEPMDVTEAIKSVTSNTLKIPPGPMAWEDKNI